MKSACPCCEGNLQQPAWGPEALHICQLCGSGFLPLEARPYDATYFDGSAGVDYEGSKRQFQLINHRRLDWIASAGAPKGRLLELGCALGFFLEAAEERGWQGWGVEISEFAAAKARQRFGERIFTGVLEQAPKDWSSLALAGGFHVLEHVPDPAGMVADLAGRLQDGGCLVWEVPDFGSSRARQERERWQYFLPGEHINYFTVAGLRALHERHGLELILVKRCSFTRLLGGIDKAGLRGLREFILKNLRWLAWVKQMVLAFKGLLGSHDCVFVVARKKGT